MITGLIGGTPDRQVTVIPFIATAQEQSAASMADFYGGLTAHDGIWASTGGKGGSSLVTSVADSNIGNAPQAAIAARLHKERAKCRMWRICAARLPSTLHAFLTPDVLPEAALQGVQDCAVEKTGATLIEFPEDVARLPVAARGLRVSQTLQRCSDVDLSDPDFVKTAESHGAAG